MVGYFEPTTPLFRVIGQCCWLCYSLPDMKWHVYASVGLLLFCLFGLGYSWVWWFMTGRRQPGKRTGRTVTALVYNTLLPLLLMGFLPRCYVPLSYALIGLPCVAVGLLLAQEKLRRLLAAYALVCYLMFVAMIPTAPPAERSGLSQNSRRAQECQSSE